jgi:hypothetical protein
MLQEYDSLPEGLLEAESRALDTLLGGPALIHLSGTRQPALFLSVLMHGNEPVGWDAIRALLKDRRERFGELRLPRALSLFIGNVSAAASGVRHLPGQPDYNRVWPGSPLDPTLEHAMMARVVEIMSERGVFASLDLHNNTGLNPHYACVNRLDDTFLHLATLFGRTVVYFIRPRGVQSQAMAGLCPAVTLECGKVRDQRGIDHAREFIDACLRLSDLPDQPVASHDIDLFHTVAQVKVPAEVAFAFAGSDTAAQADLVLSPELERLNFRELPAGTAFGRCTDRVALDVRDEWGRDVQRHYFDSAGGEIRLRVAVMPSMLTRDETVIRQDCLCYLMERYDHRVPRRD